MQDHDHGIPRERVTGSTVALRNEEDDGGKLIDQAQLDVLDDGPEKSVQTWSRIGRRPILVAGAERELELARAQRWTVVGIQHDWTSVFHEVRAAGTLSSD